MTQDVNRRRFLLQTMSAAGGALILSAPSLADEKKEGTEAEEDVSPVEDLMREHGGLNRILLIYEEMQRRIHAKTRPSPEPLAKSVKLIQTFIEGYHEKLEEEHLFPRLKKAGKLTDLVDTLFEQHHAGRKLTETILALSTEAHFKSEKDLETLSGALSKFIRMYRPHEAREDTILFPAFKTVVPPKEYDLLGDQFEKREHELFGKEGFEGIVEQIAEIEKGLGIYDLSKFTP